MTPPKPKIVYICGMGHNGSTSLDLLLDLSPEIVGTSQLNDLFVLYHPSQKETSEQTDLDRFWLSVGSKLSPDQQDLLAEANRGILKEKELLRFAFSRSARQQYAEANEALVDCLLARTQTNVIVDSSKNVSRCLGLLESKYDVFVIHLTRDVRGYVESHNKRRGEVGKSPIYLKSTLIWLAKNIVTSVLVRPRAKHYLLVQYEELLRNPDSTLDTLSAFLDVPLEACREAIRGNAPIRPSQSLGFEGNRVLHARKDVVLDPTRMRSDGLFRSRIYWFALGWVSMFWRYRFKPNQGVALEQAS
jgi:hypothetical protein